MPIGKQTRVLCLGVAAMAACGDDLGVRPVNSTGATGAADAAGFADATPLEGEAQAGLADGAAAPQGRAAVLNAFASSACKSQPAPKSLTAHLRGLQVIHDETGLAGLRCVAWERVGGDVLKLDLYNFDAACAESWNGDVALAADGSLALQVDNPGCQAMHCGICLYDWSFDVQVSVAANAEVPVNLTSSACAGQQSGTQLSLAIGSEAKGIRCTLASYGALNWQASATGTCGEAGMPCVGSLLCGSGSFSSTGTCADGLVCDSSAAANQPSCFVPCTTVADCPRADVYGCQAGLCRPVSP